MFVIILCSPELACDKENFSLFLNNVSSVGMNRPKLPYSPNFILSKVFVVFLFLYNVVYGFLFAALYIVLSIVM